MTIPQVEARLIEWLHREPFAPFAVEFIDGQSIEVMHPRLSVDFNGAGFIGPDGGIVNIDFKSVRAIRLLHSKATA